MNSFLKNKKILVIIFLSVFVCSNLLYASHPARAQDLLGGDEEIGDLFLGDTIPPDMGSDKCTAEWKGGWATAGLLEFGAAIIKAFFGLPKVLAGLISDLASYVIGTVLNLPITTGKGISAPFLTGWKTTRDLANMLIVLGFVIVGIATALRIQEYTAKKFLGKLIIVALLINFSGLFCGLIIDASNLTMNGVLNQNDSQKSGGVADMSKNFYSRITSLEDDALCEAIKKGGAAGLGQYAVVVIAFAVTYCLLAISFLFLAIVLIARFGVLGILFVLSPLAFVFFAFPFPDASGLAKKWWSNFLKWAFVGVGICFFLNLSGQIAEGLKLTGATELPFLTVFQFLAVSIGVMVTGIWITLKSSGAVSAAAMGAALTMGGFVAKKTAGGMQLDRGVNALKTGATKLGERVGLVAPGTAAGIEAKRLEEPEKRLKNMKSDELAKIAQQMPMTKRMGEEKAAAAKILAERNDLGDIKDEDARRRAVAHASSYTGVKRSDFNKADYRMAQYDPSVRKRIGKDQAGRIATMMATTPGMTRDKAIDQIARQEQLEQNLPSMSASARRKIDVNDITPDLLLSDKFNSGVIRDFRTADGNHRDAIASAVASTQFNDAVNNARNANNTAEVNKLMSIVQEAQRMPGTSSAPTPASTPPAAQSPGRQSRYRLRRP